MTLKLSSRRWCEHCLFFGKDDEVTEHEKSCKPGIMQNHVSKCSHCACALELHYICCYCDTIIDPAPKSAA